MTDPPRTISKAEPQSARQRRKFVAGALEQAAQILGAVAASVLVVGLVGPYIAALTGASQVSSATLGEVAGLALAIAGASAVTAIVLRGLSRRANDDGAVQALPAEQGPP